MACRLRRYFYRAGVRLIVSCWPARVESIAICVTRPNVSESLSRPLYLAVAVTVAASYGLFLGVFPVRLTPYLISARLLRPSCRLRYF